jgi:hypothetical protein
MAVLGMSRRYRGQPKKYRGVTYKSYFEVDVAKELSRLKRKLKKKFETKYEAETFPYVLYRNYTPDFKVTREDDSVLYIEAKGVLDRETKAKMLAIRDSNPDHTFVLLFPPRPSLSKKRAAEYARWCYKHDFEFSVGDIPEEWLVVEC